MNLTNTSTVTAKVDEAVHLGHNLKFSYNIAQGETNPTKVVVTAEKENNNDFPMLPDSKIEVTVEEALATPLVKCPAGTPKQLIDDMAAQCLILINGEEA